MPRVSEAHLAARRQQILDAARTCFLRNGFHHTSMQDVIAEAGLSVGAVYRYFRSKNDIVEAIAELYSSQLRSQLADLVAVQERSMADIMAKAIRLIDASIGPDGPMRLAVQVWAEALRDERVGAIAERIYNGLRGSFVTIARRAAENGELPPDSDPDAIGAALFSLALGYALQHLLTGRPDCRTYTKGVRQLLAARGA